MKKYTKISLAAIFGLLTVTSCDVMDTKPMESYDEALVWGSKETAEAFVLQTYDNSVKLYAYNNVKMESKTPNGINSNLNNLDGFATETGIDRYTNMGFGYFSELRRCNLIIEKVSGGPLSEGVKKQLVAEGHFLRGLIFFHQARWIGRFVPITKLLTPDDKEAFKTPLTANVAESYKVVIADLKKAAEGLPETSMPGRANKYTAYAFLSRAALQAYAYTKEASYLDLCIESSKKVIANPAFKLTSNYGDMFLEGGKNDSEIILALYRLDQNTNVENIPEIMETVPCTSNDDMDKALCTPHFKEPGGTRSFGGWGTYFPTQELVDQYLVIDEVDGKAKIWTETSQYKKNIQDLNPKSIVKGSFSKAEYTKHKIPEDRDMASNLKGDVMKSYAKSITGVNVNKVMYENRDKRFYGTIVYDSCSWLRNELVYTRCHGNLWAGSRNADQSDSWYTTASGYYWKKGVYDNQAGCYYTVKTNYHYVIARLGEMYMNLAEAYLLKKNVAEAVSNLNMTRVQHGGLPASTATTEEEAWKDYKRERRVEMACENDIYWSYLRWGKYGGLANDGKAAEEVIDDLNVPVHKIVISKDGKQFYTAQIWRNEAWNRNFTTRRYLMPIPQGIIDKRAASGINDTQNPGW